MKINNKLIGYLVLLIPIVLFGYNSIKNIEKFSLLSFFNKEKEEKSIKNNIDNNENTNNQNIISNNKENDTIFANQFINQKKGPIYNQNDMINNNLNEIKRPKGKLEPAGNSLFGNIQCRLLNECNKTYKPTGAEFNSSVCPPKKNIKGAKAVAKIKNGFIDEIFILDSGLGYTETPKINIEGGNGIDAYAVAILDNGKIIRIDIKNRGKNYDSTPNINIEEPLNNNNCKLCCKIN